MSARFRRLDTNAPHTKPSWTAMVNHAAALAERLHSACSWETTAEAENHVVIDRISTTASNARANHRSVT
jgi:hypothetical protein